MMYWSVLCCSQEDEEGDDGDAWNGTVDENGFPTGRVPEEKKKIEALPPVDHSQIEVG